MNKQELQELLKNRFPLTPIYLLDREYVLPSIEEFMKIIKSTDAHKHNYITEKFDCDDFSIVLLSAVKEYQWKNSCGPFSFGFTMLQIPYGPFHMMNLVVTNDNNIWLIEPRTNEISLVQTKIIPKVIFM